MAANETGIAAGGIFYNCQPVLQLSLFIIEVKNFCLALFVERELLMV